MERNPGSTPSQNFSKTQLSSMPVPRAQTKYSKELVKFDKNEIQGYSSAMKKTSTLNFRTYNNNISRKCDLRPRRCLGSKSRPPVRCWNPISLPQTLNGSWVFENQNFIECWSPTCWSWKAAVIQTGKMEQAGQIKAAHEDIESRLRLVGSAVDWENSFWLEKESGKDWFGDSSAT